MIRLALLPPGASRLATVTHHSETAATIRCERASIEILREASEPREAFEARAFEAARAFLPTRIDVVPLQMFEEIRDAIPIDER